MNPTSQLHELLAAVAPIDGVSIGTLSDKATWVVAFKAEATDSQKQAAASVVANFAPAPTFVARDMLSQFTAADYAAVQNATASSPALGLLWASLLGQGEAPIKTDAQRFRDGWAGLTQALGADRAAAIAGALGFSP